MRQNKELFQLEFKKFIDLEQNSLQNKETNPLFTFILKTEFSNLSALLDSKQLRDQIYFYWKILDDSEEFLGFGPIFKISENGDNRLIKTGEIVKNFETNIISNWEVSELINIPIFLGGIKFSPNQKSERWQDFNDSDWFIPRILFLNNTDGAYFVYNFFRQAEKGFDYLTEFEQILNEINGIFDEHFVESSENLITEPFYSNSRDGWKDLVNSALKSISEGEFSKVVLSREVNLGLNNKPQVSNLVQNLSEKYPKCYTFAYKKGESVFIGASPEKLAKFSKGWIEIDALAGSAPRGLSEEEDIQLENFLLNSKKNLNEQESVVKFIANLISGISDEVQYDEKPIIRKLPNIQHLWTFITAKLNKNYKLFDVLLKLHPTPAICGSPWDVAQKYILENETHDRGLYSGNIGWFNVHGTGEFAVAIRSALIKNNEALCLLWLWHC